jgi:hypothetical protein
MTDETIQGGPTRALHRTATLPVNAVTVGRWESGRFHMPESKPETENRFNRITAIVALIGAMVPLTAGINGWYGVQVEREKFLTQMRLNFLDRALDPTKTSTYRESIIRYLLESIEPSDPLYKWAYNQVRVTEEIRKLEKGIDILDANLKKAGTELALEQGSRSRERSIASARESELRNQLEKAKQERARLEQALRDAELKIGRPTVVTPNELPKNPGVNLICGSAVNSPCGSCDATETGGFCCVSCNLKQLPSPTRPRE